MTPDTPTRTVRDNWDGTVRLKLYTELGHLLPQHIGWHSPFAIHWLNDGESTQLPVRYGLATFVRNTFEVVDDRTFFIFGDGPAGPESSPPLPRNLHAVRVRSPEGVEYVIAHFHGLWLKGGRADCPVREVQAGRIVEALAWFTRPYERLVLCGDMNILPESALFPLLERMFGLRDLVVPGGFPETRTEMVVEEIRDAYADYMLVSPNIQVSKFDVLREPVVSDHCPLVLDCE